MEMDVLQIRNIVEAAMNDNGRTSLLSPAALLLAASWGYGLAVRSRAALYRKGRLKSCCLPCKTISIGNIVAGGTGKTPMTIWLAGRLREAGVRVAVISRGYGGSAEKNSGVVSNGKQVLMGPEKAGDEPFMMANQLPGVPVMAGRNRYASSMMAIKRFGCDAVILDDGFQHLRLERDLDLVLIDSRRPLGNGLMLPRGPLREPASALGRAQGLVLTRCENGAPVAHILKQYAPSAPVFQSVHAPYLSLFLKAGQRPQSAVMLERHKAIDCKYLLKRRVMGISGIARNNAFRETLLNLKADLVGFAGFPDHHLYTDQDICAILKTARQRSADLLATTEKDWVRLVSQGPWPIDVLVVGVRFVPASDGDALFRMVEKIVSH